MPETTADAQGLTDSQLRDVRRHAEATVHETRSKMRAGTATSADYSEGITSAREAVAARDELGRRAANRAHQSLVHRIGLRRHPLTLARDLDPNVLDGVPLNPDLLSDGELGELRSLLRQRREREITDDGLTRFEELVGKAAGEPGLYQRRRAEIERSRTMKAEATKLARAFLPTRRHDPEPGSIELPSFLFAWVTNGLDDSFDIADLGMLAALVYSFANESGDLWARGSFVHDELGPSIVIGKSGTAHPRLTRGADDSGHLQVLDHLSCLKRNGWIDTANVRGVWTIRPGERMRKLWPN